LNCRQRKIGNCQRCGSPSAPSLPAGQAGLRRAGAAFPNFRARAGNFPEKCVRTNSRILHQRKVFFAFFILRALDKIDKLYILYAEYINLSLPFVFKGGEK